MTLIARLKVALAQFEGVLETAVNDPNSKASRIPHVVGSLSDTVQRHTWFRVQRRLLQVGIREIESGKPITPFMQMLYEVTAMSVMVISKRLLEADGDGGNCNKRSTLVGDWCRGQRWASLMEDEEGDALTDAFLTVRKRDVRIVGARSDWDIMFERMWKQVINKSGGKAPVKVMLAKYTIPKYMEFLSSFENHWLSYWQSMVAVDKAKYIIGMERFVREEVWRRTPQEHYDLDRGGSKSNVSPEAAANREKVKEYKKKHSGEEIEVVEDVDLGGM